jgi:arylsulfatase A-like enzyme
MTLMLLALAAATPAYAAPNFVVIMTDDQDDTGSIDTMPAVQRLAQEGITFTNSFVNFSLCAPSRASFLSGQAAHNHGILQNEDAYSTFAPREANALGVWLQQAGYATALIGKVINHYGDVDPTHVMPGWSQWHVIGDAGYFNYSINDNGVLHDHGDAAEDYQTDVLAQKAVDFIKHRAARPFFLLITPNAPHGRSKPGTAVPAPRDDGRFANLRFDKRPNFNETNVSDKPGVIRNLPLLNVAGVVDKFRKRRETLLAVDDLVSGVIQALRDMNVLKNTIVVFTSDNGFSLGSHRVYGKEIVYEESIRVPLIVRWPGLPGGQTRDQMVTNLDLVATVIDAAGATAGNPLDGRSLKPLIADGNTPWRSALGIEGTIPNDIDAYAGVRTKDFVYAEHHYATYGDEREFYDLVEDPYQKKNKIGVSKYKPVIEFLKNCLATLKSCVGSSCWITSQPPVPK